MINILLSLYSFDRVEFHKILKGIIKPHHKVLIVPFSYDDRWLKNEYDFYNYFNDVDGTHYEEIVFPFLSYGIDEGNILWINHFLDDIDTMKKKIKNTDIIFFTGGFPDKMMDKFLKYNLIDTLENFDKIMIGSSAGAMVQISEYHITPDSDYEYFSYNKGLNIINDFDIDVHFDNSEVHNLSILKTIKEKQKPVYSIPDDGGVVVLGDKVLLLGTAMKWPHYKID